MIRLSEKFRNGVINTYNQVSNSGGNNNPGNIRNLGGTPFDGETTQDGATFKSFSSLAYGLRAMMKLIKTYYSQGFTTVTQVITKYAPPSDSNPTDIYIQNVSDAIPLDANADLSGVIATENLFANMILAMCTQEGEGYEITADDLQTAFNLL